MLPSKNISNYLFVKNIAPEVAEADIKCLFEQYGEMNQCRLLPGNGFSKKAILEYHSLSSAITAVDELNGTVIFGRRVHIAFPHETSHKTNQRKYNASKS